MWDLFGGRFLDQIFSPKIFRKKLELHHLRNRESSKKKIVAHLELQTTSFLWMFGETTIFHVKIWNHPIETIPFINGCFEFQATLLPIPIFLLNSSGWAANGQPAARDRAVEVGDPEHEVHQVRGKFDDKFHVESCGSTNLYRLPNGALAPVEGPWCQATGKYHVTEMGSGTEFPTATRGHVGLAVFQQFCASKLWKYLVDFWEGSSNFGTRKKHKKTKKNVNVQRRFWAWKQIFAIGAAPGSMAVERNSCLKAHQRAKLHEAFSHFDCAVLGCQQDFHSRVEIFLSWNPWKDSQLLTIFNRLWWCVQGAVGAISTGFTPSRCKKKPTHASTKSMGSEVWGPDFFRCISFRYVMSKLLDRTWRQVLKDIWTYSMAWDFCDLLCDMLHFLKSMLVKQAFGFLGDVYVNDAFGTAHRAHSLLSCSRVARAEHSKWAVTQILVRWLYYPTI